MDRWHPRATVATVIERNGTYLMVQERDKTSGRMVFNQPAGHLEQNESLTEAALRECHEETGWDVELTGFLGVSLYTAPANGLTYLRNTFTAKPVREVPGAVIDPDIHAVHWLGYEEIVAKSAKMRSPLVIASIERYRQGKHYPLDLIFPA